MQSQSESPNKPINSLSQLVQNMLSNNNSNIMLAAIVSLLLVILFVLLLHIYAKLFLAPAIPGRQRRRTLSTVEPSRFHHFHFIEASPISNKGLDSSIVSRIPMFVHEAESEELECVICLSGFEEGEIGRSLSKCGHTFHLECIDMWLSSHCNCPICRATIVVQNNDGDNDGVVEIVIESPSYEISESGSDNYGNSGVNSVSQTSSSLLLGFSLKKMLSKVFQYSNVNELHGSQ
ncbi:putative transcription factor C2H2 family [Lupinus albus]|uniref:RING-type E3 ubiquitin transferase n=1 Tax=Lupinus albus TaxID=3870 RepID=A0A6A4QLL0_LUPAL|nr:putative transcription factor C2H2 family [Lupinus albus]